MSGTTGVEKLDHPGQKVQIPDANYLMTSHGIWLDGMEPDQSSDFIMVWYSLEEETPIGDGVWIT